MKTKTKQGIRAIMALLMVLLMTIGAMPQEVIAAAIESTATSQTITSAPTANNDTIIVTIADEEVKLPPDGIVTVEVDGQRVELEIPRHIYIDGERIPIDDERIESITPVMPTNDSQRARGLSSDNTPLPRVAFIVPFSIPSNVPIFSPSGDVEFDGNRLWLTTADEGRMEVGARRYFVVINGMYYEAYCGNPNLRGPGDPGAAYVMTGNQAEQFRPVLRYGHPHNPHQDTLSENGRRWFLYMGRTLRVLLAHATWGKTPK